MNQRAAWKHFVDLPPDAQQKVTAFILFLERRGKPAASGRSRRQVKLSEEPFVGMWRDRQDMRDGTAWVREIRTREWVRRNG